MVNEVNRRKSTVRAKLKAASQEEWIHLWKQHFKNFLGKLLKVMVEPIMKIISNQLDIKLGQFTWEKLNSIQRKIKNRKAAGLDEIPQEAWKTREFNDILLRYCNAVYNQNTIDRWTKSCFFLFSKKGDLIIAKNYRSITFTSIVYEIYNALLCYRIEPKIEKILRKNQNGFQRNQFTTSQILTIRRIREGVCAKISRQHYFSSTSQRHWLHTQREDDANTSCLPKETVAAIMMLYKKHKSKSPLTGWRHRLLRHCSMCAARRHINSMPIYYLPRLHA